MAAPDEVTSRCFVFVDGELDERRQRAGVALSQRHFSKKQYKTFTMLSSGWQDGRWCGGIISLCRCLCETDTSFCFLSVFVCIGVFFSISSPFLPVTPSLPPPPLSVSLYYVMFPLWL